MYWPMPGVANVLESNIMQMNCKYLLYAKSYLGCNWIFNDVAGRSMAHRVPIIVTPQDKLRLVRTLSGHLRSDCETQLEWIRH